MKEIINICGITYYRYGSNIIAKCNFGNDMIKSRIWTIDDFIAYCHTKWWLNTLADQMKKTRKAYEQYLNEYYAEWDNMLVYKQMIYFTSRSRNIRLTHVRLWYWIYSHKVGSLIRKYDSIAFNIGYNEWDP